MLAAEQGDAVQHQIAANYFAGTGIEKNKLYAHTGK